MPQSKTYFLKSASIIIGAFFCLFVSACDDKKKTPSWEQQETKVLANQAPTPVTLTKPAEPLTEPVRFLAYNLKNYLTYTKETPDGKISRSKPAQEIAALVEIITAANPHILGICEIGTTKDLEDLQNRLKSQGITLPHSQLTRGADQTRSLAILSRFPIVKTTEPQQSHFTLNGLKLQISRSILDTTIQLPGQQIRLLGVHLKSKRPSQIANQALIRKNESILLRKHIDSILTENPETELLVYGDMNDSRRSSTLDSVRGRSNSPLSLSILELKDSRSESWTHYWSQEDIYSRFDYIATSRRLQKRITPLKSRILDPANWNTASDHRPLLVVLE